uniref:Uncharacterized protein n=1 Tax=Lepeophtheirus salmonis TaxID=72036 RepID=A0A0K2U0D3_LEPSM
MLLETENYVDSR